MPPLRAHPFAAASQWRYPGERNMKCSILHESSGRMRVHLFCGRMNLRQADVLEYYLKNVEGVSEAAVYDRTQDAIIRYKGNRGTVISALARFSFPVAE